MIINFDKFNRAEQPLLFLCNPGCTYSNGRLSNAVGILDNVHDLELVANFNEVSEINFRTYKTTHSDSAQNSQLKDLYRGIKNRRMIYVEDIGFFVINDVTTGYEDGSDFKDVSALSVEAELQAKQVPYIQNGTYQLHSPIGSHGLLNIIMESMPMWSIGHIDSTAGEKNRTFEDVDTDNNILSFMIQDMQDAYECIFLFNITTRTVNVYDQNSYVVQTPIHITRDDIVTSVEISENADDLYTALTVFGADDLTINAVNPIGSGTVYNFDYYLDWMTSGLRTKVNSWKTILSSNETAYATSQTGYYGAMQSVSAKQADVDRLDTSIDLYQRCYDNIVAEGDSSSVVSYNRSLSQGSTKLAVLVETGLSKSHEQWEDLVDEHSSITATSQSIDYSSFINVGDKVQFKGDDTTTGSYYYVLATVTSVTSTTVIGTASDGSPVILETGEGYTRAEWDDIANTPTLTDWDVSFIPISLDGGSIAQIQGSITDEPGESYYVPVTITEIDGTTVTTSARGSSSEKFDVAGLQSRIVDEIRSAQDARDDAYDDLQEAIAEAQSYKNTSAIIVATSSLSPRTDAYIRSGATEYGADWLSLTSGGAALSPVLGKRYYILTSGSHSGKSYTWSGVSYVYIDPNSHPFVDFTQSDYGEMFNYIFEGTYTDEYISITDSMSYPEKYAQMGVLYNRAKEQLAKISSPTQEYEVEAENFVFNKDFEHFTSELETGRLVNVELDDGDVAALFLSSITINWEDKELSFKFGNRFNRYDVRSLFDDVLGSVKKSANTISYMKNILYPVKDDTDELKLYYENARNLTKTDALYATDNVVVIDDTGISVKKKVGGSYDDKQLKITNNQLVFTSDAWLNCDAAIGDITLGDGTTTYGVTAKMLSGDVVEGSRIYGTNITGSNITGTTIAGSTVSATNINGGTITGTDIVGGSINVPNGTNPNFSVDGSGNVAMSGSINMSSGSITWGAGSSPTKVLYAVSNIPKPTLPYDSYPSSSLSGWHKVMSASDRYVSYSYDGGTTWTDAIKTIATDGTPGTNGYNTAITYLYMRSATVPSIEWSNALTYSFDLKRITSSLPSGWFASIPPDDGNPCYVTAASAYSNTSTDTIYANEWSTPVLFVRDGTNGTNGRDGTDGEDGTDGLNSATVFLYQRSSSSPSRPSSALTYTFATGILSGSLGSWSQTIPSGTDPCYVTQASAVSASATDTIAASEWSTVTMMVENGTDGTDGRGVSSSSVTYQAGASGTTAPTGEWSSTVPTLTPGQYLWTRIIMAYTDSTTSTSYSVSQKAVGISSVVPQYYLSTSSSTQTGGSWSTAVPTWESGKYIWTRSYITWDDSSTTTTTPVLDNAINGMGASYAEIKYDVDHIDIDVLAKQKSATYGFTSDGMTVTVNSIEQIKLGTDGKLTAKNAEIEGEVVAESGSIGNFSIENGALHAAPTSGTGAELKLSNAGVDIQWGPEVFGYFSAIDNEHGELYVAGDGSSYGSHCNIQGANILSVGGSIAIESNNAEVSFTDSVLAGVASDGRGVITLKNSSGNDAVKLYGNVNNNGRIDVLYNGSNKASLWVNSSGVGRLTLYSSSGSSATLDYDKLVQLLALI